MADQVELRPVTEDDLPVLDRLRADPVAAGRFAWFGWRDLDAFRRRWAEDRLLGEERSILMVTAGSEPLGLVSWRKMPVHTAYYWNMGIALLPEARGRGIGTEAQRLLVRYLFTHTPVNRVEADTEIENIAEQRALEKAGFTREGVIRGCVYRAGRWHDGVIYGILRDEVEIEDVPL